MYLQSLFLAKIRKISKKNLLKIFHFYNFRKICILHGRVFVMVEKNAILISKFKTGQH